jgi:transposase
MGWRQRSRNEWQRLVAGWPRSGLTQEVYCARHGISVGSLQRWRRIFAEDAEPGSRASSPVSEFVPVTLVGEPATPNAELTLVLTDGLRLEIGAQCQAETLKRVSGCAAGDAHDRVGRAHQGVSGTRPHRHALPDRRSRGPGRGRAAGGSVLESSVRVLQSGTGQDQGAGLVSQWLLDVVPAPGEAALSGGRRARTRVRWSCRCASCNGCWKVSIRPPCRAIGRRLFLCFSL